MSGNFVCQHTHRLDCRGSTTEELKTDGFIVRSSHIFPVVVIVLALMRHLLNNKMMSGRTVVVDSSDNRNCNNRTKRDDDDDKWKKAQNEYQVVEEEAAGPPMPLLADERQQLLDDHMREIEWRKTVHRLQQENAIREHVHQTLRRQLKMAYVLMDDHGINNVSDEQEEEKDAIVQKEEEEGVSVGGNVTGEDSCTTYSSSCRDEGKKNLEVDKLAAMSSPRCVREIQNEQIVNSFGLDFVSLGDDDTPTETTHSQSSIPAITPKTGLSSLLSQMSTMFDPHNERYERRTLAHHMSQSLAEIHAQLELLKEEAMDKKETNQRLQQEMQCAHGILHKHGIFVQDIVSDLLAAEQNSPSLPPSFGPTTMQTKTRTTTTMTATTPSSWSHKRRKQKKKQVVVSNKTTMNDSKPDNRTTTTTTTTTKKWAPSAAADAKEDEEPAPPIFSIREITLTDVVEDVTELDQEEEEEARILGRDNHARLLV